MVETWLNPPVGVAPPVGATDATSGNDSATDVDTLQQPAVLELWRIKPQRL